MEVEKLQRLNDQRKYILDLENFKERVLKVIVGGEQVSSIKVIVETKFGDINGTSQLCTPDGMLRTMYDGCPMREDDKKSLTDFIDEMIAKENKKFQEM